MQASLHYHALTPTGGSEEGECGLKRFKEVAAKLPEIKDSEDLELKTTEPEPERADGAALRALRVLLDEKDPQQQWGGLKKLLTPEGHYLWLCEHHAAQYKQ